MLNPLSTFVFAASVCAVAIVLPAQAKDSEAIPAPATASSVATARAQTTASTVKRVRKQPRRVASVAPASAYHPQCFMFWCTAGGRPFNFLMLGVAY